MKYKVIAEHDDGARYLIAECCGVHDARFIAKAYNENAEDMGRDRVTYVVSS